MRAIGWLAVALVACDGGPIGGDPGGDAAPVDAPTDAADIDTTPLDTPTVDAAQTVDAAPLDALTVDAPSGPPFTDLSALDPAFATGGLAIIPGAVWQVDIQADQKIVVAGLRYASYTGFVTRLLPDGSPDPGFGTGGEITGAGDNYPSVLAILADGRIAVAGLGAAPLVVLDGSGAIASLPALPAAPPPANWPLLVQALIPLADGGFLALVVASEATSPTLPVARAPGLVRYDAAGQLVTTFGTGGLAMLGAMRLGDGRYAATLVHTAAGDHVVVERSRDVFGVSPVTGQLDGTFAATLVLPYWEVGARVLALPDGRVITAEPTPAGDFHSTTLVQALAADGTRGPALTLSYCDVETPDWANAGGLALDPQGRTVVAPWHSHGEDVVSLARIDAAAAAIDPGWGCGTGFRLPPMCAARPCGDIATAEDAAVAADGSTVVVGTQFRAGSGTRGFIARVRP